MKKVYEAWQDEPTCSITFAPPEAIQQERATGSISDGAKLLYRVEADTFEEALAVHHIKMGWRPFVPMGEATECPRGCGAMFYPEGSGECPKCGPIC
jgi:hypothetical protein